MNTSNSANAKIKRAVSQLHNAERLIASLPRRYYEDDHTREIIRKVTGELIRTAEIIKAELEHINNNKDLK